MNLWANFGQKFTLFYMGKMAKISPKINKIEIRPKLRSKVINSRNKNKGRFLFLKSWVNSIHKKAQLYHSAVLIWNLDLASTRSTGQCLSQPKNS